MFGAEGGGEGGGIALEQRGSDGGGELLPSSRGAAAEGAAIALEQRGDEKRVDGGATRRMDGCVVKEKDEEVASEGRELQRKAREAALPPLIREMLAIVNLE